MNSKIIEKIIDYYGKDKQKKVNKLLIKNGNNTELFDELLKEEDFLGGLYPIFDSIIMKKLSVDIQKKIIEKNIDFLEEASSELRNDKNYIEELARKQATGEIDARTSAYYYIGDQLSKDEEYMLSIKDKNAWVFVENISNYSDDTVIEFFNQYPELISYLPKRFKYNFEYVKTIIEKISIEHLESALSELEYSYLSSNDIKKILINYVGLEKYNEMLLEFLRGSSYEKFLKEISSEELIKQIRAYPTIVLEHDFNSFSFNKKKRENINILTKFNDLISNSLNVNNQEEFSNLIIELQNFISEEKINSDKIKEQVNIHWNQIEIWLIELKQLYGEELDQAWAKGQIFNALDNILFGIKSDAIEDISKIFIESGSISSFYIKNIKNIQITNGNIDFLRLICNTPIFGKNDEMLNFYQKLFLKFNKLSNNPYNSLDFILMLNRDEKLASLIKNSDIDSLDPDLLQKTYTYLNTKLNSFIEVSNLEQLRNYDDLINKATESMSENKLDELKNRIMLEHFQISEKYGKELLHSYFSSNENANIFKEMPEILFIKDTFQKIINSNNIEELKKISQELKNKNIKILFSEIDNIKNIIKEKYGESINQSLSKFDKNEKIIDFTNNNFNLLVHVIGGYGKTPDVNELYSSWIKNSKPTICTSLISDNNMGVAPMNNHSIVFGFDDLPKEYLEIMSCQDLYSSGFKANRKSTFLNVEELRNNTRHGHNELVIRSNYGDYVEDKVLPSYIVCFDFVNEESKIASEQFNIPIVFIDREKVAQMKNQEIRHLLDNFAETLNHENISKIICEQENNKAGLRLSRPDLVEKYFSKSFRNSNIEKMYEIINKQLENNNPKAVRAMQEFVRGLEEEREKFKVTNETPHRRNKFDLDCDNFIQEFKNNPKFNQEIIEEEKLSAEEAYERFLEYRNKLALQEALELQYINVKEQENIEENNISKKVG